MSLLRKNPDTIVLKFDKSHIGDGVAFLFQYDDMMKGTHEE